MTATRTLDIAAIRADFPILAREVNGRPLVYLDNAATSQKPQRVIEAIDRYYRHTNANVHRGVHTLSQEADALYDGARETVRRFLNAPSIDEIVFVRGTTEAINLVAYGWLLPRLHEGDEILVSESEHHANIVPWQIVAARRGARVRVMPVNDHGELILERVPELITGRTRIVGIGHVSNALGTIHPVREVIALAHEKGVPVLVDGAQAVPHMPVDVQALDADFYAFSAHKVFGPTGTGALWGRAELLEQTQPWMGGGDMIDSVSFDGTTFAPVPLRFEAGTPNVAGVIGMGEALAYVMEIGADAIAAAEHRLLVRATDALSAIDGLRIVGTSEAKAAVISFVMEGAHPHDIGAILDEQGIAIRAGQHCAEPVIRRMGLTATARASFAFYNTEDEVDALVRGLHTVNDLFGA